MGLVNLPTNLTDRVKQLEQQVQKLWKATGLSSATIAAGGLTLLNNAFFKMLGATNNELVYIGPDGAQQVVRFRDAAGNIIFGSVSGGTNGQRVAINPEPTSLPRIDVYDDTTTDHTTQVMFGGNFLMQRETNADRTIDGGKVLFSSSTSYFGHQTATSDAFLALGSDEGIQLKGHWVSAAAISGLSAVWCGSADVSSSFQGLLLSYGATMASRMCPVFSVFYNGGVITDHNVDNETTTGFGMTWDPAADIRVNYWVFRTEQAF